MERKRTRGDNTTEKQKIAGVRGKEKERDTTDELYYREVMQAIEREGQKEGEGKSKNRYSVPYIFSKKESHAPNRLCMNTKPV